MIKNTIKTLAKNGKLIVHVFTPSVGVVQLKFDKFHPLTKTFLKSCDIPAKPFIFQCCIDRDLKVRQVIEDTNENPIMSSYRSLAVNYLYSLLIQNLQNEKPN